MPLLQHGMKKKCCQRIQCLTLIPTQVAKTRTISKATLWTNTKLAKCMETPLMTFKDVNNIALVLCQGDQELNDPYTFVDKEEFNVRPGIGGKVAFV